MSSKKNYINSQKKQQNNKMTTFQYSTVLDINLENDLDLLRTETKLTANYSIDIELDLNAAFASVELHGVPKPNTSEIDSSSLGYTENLSYAQELFTEMNAIKNGDWASVANDGESPSVSLNDQVLDVVRRCLYEQGYPTLSEGADNASEAGDGQVIDTTKLSDWINARFSSFALEVASASNTTLDFGEMLFQASQLNEIFQRAVNANRYLFNTQTETATIDFENGDACSVKCILHNSDDSNQVSFVMSMHHKGSSA